MDILQTLKDLWADSGFNSFFVDGGWKNLVMIGIACVLLYLGIKKSLSRFFSLVLHSAVCW